MALILYNTFIRKKAPFKEIEKGKVKMYTCGPTVYYFAHIGNFRAYIAADVLRRYLEFKGYDVKHVMNITDVDDKTIRDSQKEGVTLQEFTECYTKAFFEDLYALNIEPAHEFPRATDYIKEMVAIIKILLEKGIAYKGGDGSIYYNIHKFPAYGKLAGINVGDLKAGARVKQDEYQKDQAQDFALWKNYDATDGDVFWETEIGKGRPGWHIECSAMSSKNLGHHFDIHTGGIDLVFPHHQNEIAQSEGCFGEKFVNYWLHNEWLLVDGKKMSKSMGNFFTLRDLLDKGYDARAIRYLLLATHYRQQLNFTLQGVEAAKNTLQKLDEFVSRLREVRGEKYYGALSTLMNHAKKSFEKAMDDDISISEALACVFEFIKEINILLADNALGEKNARLVLEQMFSFDAVLGLQLEKAGTGEIPKEVLALAEQRKAAKSHKNWKEADRLRELVKQKGYTIDDTPDGFRIKKLQ